MDNYKDSFFITTEEADDRLDKILAKRFEQSRTYFQYLIEVGKVLLNGNSVIKRTRPKVGDEVEVEFVFSEELKLEPQNIPLDILFEDEFILVANKPPGMTVHPAPGNWQGTFANALLYHCKNSPIFPNNSLRPGIVHRLDKDTSGVLVAAKLPLVQCALMEMFAKRDVEKEYLAICLGRPKDQQIKTLIGRHPVHREKMTVVETQGKEAITICESVAFQNKFTLIKLKLITGRTHQIRVHMKYLNCPILGDKVYGNTSMNKHYAAERQMLHAFKLKLRHPITRESLVFSAPLPSDIKSFIEKFGWDDAIL